MLKIIKKYLLVIVGVLITVTLLLIVVFLSIRINSNRSNFERIVDSATYQAVFLSNDQIYFGHLKDTGSDFLLLTDVYYVKVDDDSVGRLIKLGQIEPHGPKNEMVISKDQILFWENLRMDSSIVQTIKNNK